MVAEARGGGGHQSLAWRWRGIREFATHRSFTDTDKVGNITSFGAWKVPPPLLINNGYEGNLNTRPSTLRIGTVLS